MKLKTKCLIGAVLFVAAGLMIMPASGGMPQVYGEKMLRNILIGHEFSEREINDILSLPRMPDFNIDQAQITIRSGRQLWVEPDMSFAVIIDMNNNNAKVTQTLFHRQGK